MSSNSGGCASTETSIQQPARQCGRNTSSIVRSTNNGRETLEGLIIVRAVIAHPEQQRTCASNSAEYFQHNGSSPNGFQFINEQTRKPRWRHAPQFLQRMAGEVDRGKITSRKDRPQQLCWGK